MKRAWALLACAAAAMAQRADFTPACACGSAEAMKESRAGIAAHLRRSLEEASSAYTRALRAAPAREPDAAERELILRHAPRVMATFNDPFPLIDAAAVMHPDKPWIAYHFFWEDDIDFPDDNDPCDHEVMWVRLDDARKRVAAYFTYFHGRIVAAPAASIDDANRNGGRAAVVSQWGKHGTMPLGWQNLPIIADSGDIERKQGGDQRMTLDAYNQATWKKLATVGREAQNSPLARGWPLRYPGDYAAFTNFTRQVDAAGLLRRKGYVAVSCLNNAAINRRFLRYNFAAKTEWPETMCAR